LSKFNDCKLIILEFCHNSSLKQFFRSGAKIPLRKRLEIAAGACDGLMYLHERQVGHFDLTPHNILLTRDLTPKLCDFGLSQKVEEEFLTTSKGFTLAYCAPE
jgi:serine/threonine protein kinase